MPSPGAGGSSPGYDATGARAFHREANMARITALTLDPIRVDVANVDVAAH